jgi:selenocysteine-specific elongation factor
LLLPGDRFIIRMFSPVITIGGGAVLDIRGLRYSRRDNPLARLEEYEGAGPAGRITTLVRESPSGIGIEGLVALTGLTERAVAEAASKAPLVALSQPHRWYVDKEWFALKQKQIGATLGEFHRKHPLLPGMPKADVATSLQNPPAWVLDELLGAADLSVDGETVRLRTHRVVLKQDEEQARAAIESAFAKAGLAVPAVAEVLAQAGVEPSRARTLMQILLREKRLVRVGPDLVFHQSAIDQLRGLLADRKGQRFSVPSFKEWTGISRKYAIPLLEFLDREHVTRREGDERVVV